MTWIQQEYPKTATLADKREKLDAEPNEPTEEGARVRFGNNEFTTDEEWCSEQLRALLVAKATGPARTMIVNLDSSPQSRGVGAWYKLMREAMGTHTTQVHEVTERLHSTDRKQVQAKDVVSTLEAFDNGARKYTEVTGQSVDESFKVLTFEKLLPDKLWDMLQTSDHTTYPACKEYCHQTSPRHKECQSGD